MGVVREMIANQIVYRKRDAFELKRPCIGRKDGTDAADGA